MKATFRVKALSDLIFIASSNTEGNIRYLDYIPGSVFMGIAANVKFDRTLIDGSVRFGDAHILINGRVSLKIPLSFHYKKNGDKNLVYNYHRLNNDDFKNDQFKQIRSGYMGFEHNGKLLKREIEFNYSQKSARDKDKGRSAKSKMFGFRSIPRGSEFSFTVTGEDIDGIVKTLEGVHYVGKSKRSEYGKIEIVKDSTLNEEVKTENMDKVYIYCKSRLCLIDHNGYPTYDVLYLHPGLKSDNVVYEECKIRKYEYSPYNFQRKHWDSQRCVIDKGSVIVLQNVDKEILEDIGCGVGVFLNEGFGEVLVNPWFLKDKSYRLENYEPAQTKRSQKSPLADILKKRKENKDTKTEIISEVYELVNNKNFVKWFSNITPSQWGNIRKLSEKSNYYDEIEKYITTGLKRWREDQYTKFLEKIENKSPEFVKFLAIQMAKKAKK